MNDDMPLQLIVILAFFLFVALLGGCVSIKTHEDQVQQAYHLGIEHSLQYLSRHNCEETKWLVGSDLSVWELKN